MAKLSLSPVEAAAAVELAERKRMAVRIFRPQPHQDAFFEQPRAKYTALQGGNRSGKTTCAAVLFAAIATDSQITLSDGRVVEARMPWQKGKCLRMYVVAFDESAIGRTIHRVLLKKGLFKVATDPITKELRAYDPEKDVNLKAKDSPPLIPARYIKKIAWSVASENIFSKIIVHNPSTGEELAEIFAFSSRGEPQPGDPVDEIWIDERCYIDNYVDEAKARLVDLDGRLTWSSWPDEESEDLKKYIEMLDREIEAGNDHIARKIVLTMSGNKHLGRKAIAEFLAGCATPEEAMARDKGLFVSVSLRMYPLFDKNVHTAIIEDPSSEDTLSRILRSTDGIPPNTWTKYLSLDPGTDHPGALLCAVPPPELGDFIVPYQEFYPGRFDAIQLAKLIKREMPNERYYRFIIDWKAAGQQPPGFETRIVDAYQSAFLNAGLVCHLSKHQFHRGSPDVGGRQLILNSFLHPGRTGLPKLRVVTHRCPHLCNQMTKVKKRVVQKEVIDEKKARGQQHDVLDCLEYIAASRPVYVYLKPSIEEASPAFQRYMKKFGSKKEPNTGFSIGTFY